MILKSYNNKNSIERPIIGETAYFISIKHKIPKIIILSHKKRYSYA